MQVFIYTVYVLIILFSAQYLKSGHVWNRKQSHLYAVRCVMNIINLGNKTPRLYRCRSCFSTALNEFVVLPTLSFRHWDDMNEVSDSRITVFVQDNARIHWFISNNCLKISAIRHDYFSKKCFLQIKLKSNLEGWNDVVYPHIPVQAQHGGGMICLF